MSIVSIISSSIIIIIVIIIIIAPSPAGPRAETARDQVPHKAGALARA